jgi:tetratricopeptide (TPR) repeat protein
MVCLRVFLCICLGAGLFSFIEPAAGETYPVILRGKVTMPDGSPPPIVVGLERICSDGYGSRPGPLTDKKGEYIWRMDVDPMRSRACVIRATHAGYESSSIDISALNGYMDINVNLDPIVITSASIDPYTILISESRVPGRAASKCKAAMKALEAGNNTEARQLFQAAVEAEPKFAMGWHALGVLSEYQDMRKEAREAYEHAIESDSKLLPPYMTLLRLCVKVKDWESAVKTADMLIKADRKSQFTEVHLHRAVALYGLKKLDEAEASALEAIRLDPYHQKPRLEYILGRILEAKGDLNGAREHMLKYLELDKSTPDAQLIRKHLELLGKAEAAEVEPELEYL